MAEHSRNTCRRMVPPLSGDWGRVSPRGRKASWALGAGHTDGIGKTVFGATSPHLEGLEALLSSQLESNDCVHSLQPRTVSSTEEPGSSFSARASERSWKQAEYKL